jgi:hypothetical protein
MVKRQAEEKQLMKEKEKKEYGKWSDNTSVPEMECNLAKCDVCNRQIPSVIN